MYFRGKKVLESVIKDLLYEKDMNTASEVLLSGTSAGGNGGLSQL